MQQETEIGEVFQVASGGTPSRSKEEYFFEGHIPWVKTGELKGKYANIPTEYITQLGLDNSSAKLFPPKTVLLAMYGATIGACSILSFEAATNQACAAILPNDKCDESYLYYFLLSIKNELISKGLGGAQPNISAGLIKKIKIPLPPLAEQKKIAAILDAADQLRQKDQQLIDHYAALSQSLFLEMFGDVFANTKLFEMYSLGDLVDKVQIGPFGSQLHKKDYIEGGVPLVNPVHIVDSKIVVDSSFTLSKEKFESLPNYHLQLNDIVMGRRGEMGRCAVVGENESGFFCGTGSLFLRPNNAVTSEFLLRAIMSKSGKDYLERNAQGVTMKNLNKKIILNMRISVPPIELQDKFCDSIKKIAQQKRIAQANLSKSKSLFNSLLQKAFKGELTSIKAA